MEGYSPIGEYPSIRQDINRSLRNEASENAAKIAGSEGSRSYSQSAIDAALDKGLSLIESTDRLYMADSKLMDIVQEITAACFAGDKSPEEAAADIQARASIYLSEQLG